MEIAVYMGVVKNKKRRVLYDYNNKVFAYGLGVFCNW